MRGLTKKPINLACGWKCARARSHFGAPAVAEWNLAELLATLRDPKYWLEVRLLTSPLRRHSRLAPLLWELDGEHWQRI